MKKRGALKSRTRSQWRVREAKLKWKKKRTRRKRFRKITLFVAEVIGLIFCISTGISMEETSAHAKATAIVVFEDEEAERKEVFEEKGSEETSEMEEYELGIVEIFSQFEEAEITIEGIVVSEEVETVEEIVAEELLAEHTISYPGSVSSSSYENRNKNMELAATTINNYVLKPGKRFSWAEVVGKTTTEKGYLIAGVVKNGKPAKDLGGGVCQVSSTLYSAVYDAGIIQEGKYYARKHRIGSKYINPKVDHEATVAVDSEPITDFWFENTLEYPIRINAETDNHTVTVRIYLLKTE